jgi:hypothetical protein
MKYHQYDKIKENEMNWNVARMGELRNAYKN